MPPRASLSLSTLPPSTPPTHTHAHTSSSCGRTERSFSALTAGSALWRELWGPRRVSVAGKDSRGS